MANNDKAGLQADIDMTLGQLRAYSDHQRAGIAFQIVTLSSSAPAELQTAARNYLLDYLGANNDKDGGS